MEKIFVQIASYRDPECTHTIRDMFAKAKYPERVSVAVCWQYKPGEDDALLVIDESYKERVAIDLVKSKDSQGVCWARNKLQKFYNGEEYTLMVDSHMRFIKNWDEELISELKRSPSQKPILSNHPAGYIPPDKLDLNARPTVLKVKPFNKMGDIRVSGELLDKAPENPLTGAFLAAGFIFTLGKFVKEIPYDPNYYFDQEEISLSARAWTHGWDIFSPSKIFVFHYYHSAGKTNNAQSRSLHWEDHKDWSAKAKLSRERYLHLFGIRPSSNPEALKEIDKYSLGNERNLEEYERFSGVDFKNCIATQKALGCGFVEDLQKYRATPINTNLVNERPDFLGVKFEEVKGEKFNSKDILKLSLFNLNLFSVDNVPKLDSNRPLGFTQRVNNDVPPGVLILENFVPKEFCESMCRYADEMIGKKLKVVDNENSTKDKVATKESSGRITEYVSIDGIAGETLSVFLDIYTRRLAPFYNNVKFEWFERPQILRYLPGGKYDPHADSEHMNKETKQWTRAQDRDYSVLLYLNEEFEGGMLNFVDFKYKIRPTTGMLVGFPSDRRYLHAAEPTISGKRYVMVSWGAILGTPRVKDVRPYASVMLNLA